MKTDLDISKLPVKVQRHIETLEMRLRERTDELNALKANEPTRVVVDSHAHLLGPDHLPTYLPDRTHIRFMFGERQYVEVRLDDDRVEIHSDSTLWVVPSASNHIYIGRRDR